MKKSATNLLKDDRFKAMFENPEFEVDKSTEEFRLLKPLITQLDKNKIKKLEKKYKEKEEDEKDEASTDDDLFSEKSDSSDDDANDKEWIKEVKKEHKKIRKERKYQREDEEMPESSKNAEMRDVDDFNVQSITSKVSKASLGARLAKEDEKPKVQMTSSFGNRQMSFSTEKKPNRGMLKRQEEMKKHREERKQVIRPITKLKKR